MKITNNGNKFVYVGTDDGGVKLNSGDTYKYKHKLHIEVTGMNKKTIESSNLALRFYRKDGWTKEELESCLEQGGLTFRNDILNGYDLSYWTLDHNHNSRFNIDKLMELKGELIRRFDDYPTDSDREFIEKMNW